MGLGHLGAEDKDRLVLALDRSRARLKSILAWFRLSNEDADDLLNDLALLAIEKFEVIENLDAWLPGAARNLCRSHLRKRRRRECLDLAQSPEPACSPPQEQLDIFTSLNDALVLMPAGLRRCLILRAIGFSCAEIADMTGYATSTVRKSITKGRKTLTSELKARTNARGEIKGNAKQRSSSDLAEILAQQYGKSDTARSYRAALKAFERWHGAESAHAAIEDLLSAGEVAARELIIRYRAALLERGAKSNTIKLYLGVLRAVVQVARQRGRVDWSLDISSVEPTAVT